MDVLIFYIIVSMRLSFLKDGYLFYYRYIFYLGFNVNFDGLFFVYFFNKMENFVVFFLWVYGVKCIFSFCNVDFSVVGSFEINRSIFIVLNVC